jgi:hypothetical protein
MPSKSGPRGLTERLSQVYPLIHSKPRYSYTRVLSYKHLAVRSKSCLKTEVERVTRALGRFPDAVRPGAYVYRSCDGFLVNWQEGIIAIPLYLGSSMRC